VLVRLINLIWHDKTVKLLNPLIEAFAELWPKRESFENLAGYLSPHFAHYFFVLGSIAIFRGAK
jgi:hypothetical protein